MNKELTEQLKKESHYLGDGLYVHNDGYQLRLYASDGVSIIEQIFLERSVVQSLLNYIEQLNNIK